MLVYTMGGTGGAIRGNGDRKTTLEVVNGVLSLTRSEETAEVVIDISGALYNNWRDEGRRPVKTRTTLLLGELQDGVITNSMQSLTV